ncbi:MAG: FHA domain-containing protein [Myxococcota bacterium]|nr:FHA domain-containing protein [Myxococcota bacterium]
MRFRLRYLQHDLELPEGEFAVGRSADCQLSLDDPLVSRRHARLIVASESVTIEDLHSRNGILINGTRVSGPVSVDIGDNIVIGSQELRILSSTEADASRGAGTLATGNRTLPKIASASDPPEADPFDGSTARPPARPSGMPAGSAAAEGAMMSERRSEAFDLLGGVAEKALAMGRADDAERLLASALGEVMDASRTGKRLAPATVDVAARFAAKLATATGKGTWADYVIALYDEQRRPCPAGVVDELYSALRKINALDLVRLRAYVSHLREKQATLGPAERFLLQRLEGLERLAALR